MLTRAEILERYGLPDSASFEMEPARLDEAQWRIKVSCEDGTSIHMGKGHAARLADEIRKIDKRLAKQLDACITEARLR